MPRPERFAAIVRGRVLPKNPDEDAVAVARRVAEGGGASVLGIVFFGSRKHRANPQPTSAFDLFVVTRDYLDFYRSLRRSGQLRRRPWLVAALNAVLPPNQVGVRAQARDGRPVLAKCAVVSLEHFLREISVRRHDHFFIGRLFQPSEIVYRADEAAGERIAGALAGAHSLTYEWVRPWLPERFDVAVYCQTLLHVSYRGEIRPEPAGRAAALWEAQRASLEPVYAVLLEDLAAEGELVRHQGGYSLARPAGLGERLRGHAYFQWSLVRATARWAKYIVTFEGWLEFLLGKARRHSGEDIVLTPRERRLPLVFLWPRVFRYFRRKDK